MFLRKVLYAHAGLGLAIQVQHVLLMLVYAGAGAALAYFRAVPTLSLIQALSSWNTAWPLLLGAGGAFLAAVLAQAQQSLFSGGASAAGKKSAPPYPGDSGPIPPAVARTWKGHGYWPTLMFAPLLACTMMACIPAQQGADAAAAVACVVAHWGEPFAQVEAACLPGQETLLADIIADLMTLLGKSDAGAAAQVYADHPAVKAALARRATK